MGRNIIPQIKGISALKCAKGGLLNPNLIPKNPDLGLSKLLVPLMSYYYYARKLIEMTLPNFFNLKFKSQNLGLILIKLSISKSNMGCLYHIPYQILSESCH